MNPPRARIGILYPGEMGAAIASALQGIGYDVVTCVSGRGEPTVRRATDNSIRIVPTIGELLEQSGIVVSVVPPDVAEEVAQSICDAASSQLIYVDVNSIRPQVAQTIAARCSQSGIDFVDAAIHGQAGKLTSGAVLYLSGERAEEIAAIFRAFMRVRVLGENPGAASQMKMTLGGLSKGLCGVFLEMAALAQRCGSLPTVLEEMHTFYPELMSPIARMLPTYLDHAGRRAQEMHELHATARAADQECMLVPGLAEMFEELAAVTNDASPPADRDIASIMKFIVNQGFLDGGRDLSFDRRRSQSHVIKTAII